MNLQTLLENEWCCPMHQTYAKYNQEERNGNRDD